MKNNIQVLDSTGAWRSAEVISEGATKKFVHFLNFPKKYDGEYEIDRIREPVEKRLIKRNLLKCPSSDLETMIMGDKIVVECDNEVNRESIVQMNDPFRGEVTV